MKGRKILLLLFTLCSGWVSAAAVDWGAFVAKSNRGDDPFIVDLLKDADLETRIQICEALGSRPDPYAEDILSWLLAGFSTSSEFKDELLLRIAMKALFDDARDEKSLQERLDANAGFLEELVRNIGKLTDPQLRGSILRLLPRLHAAGRLPALMEVGADLITALEQNGGRLSAPDTALANDYLATVQEIGGADFMEQCLQMARLSRDAGLTQKARQVAGRLAGPSR
jgi:hypothetical protein